MARSQPSSLDVREVWFSNMHLLGLQPTLCEDKYKVTFERDMFEHMNKKGSEAVVHFLFTRLDPRLSSEVFRDCWPVYDKKLEQQFRKACSNWLTRITKEAPQSKLPRTAASLLLSPGGDKFYLFLLRFSSYIMKQICMVEAKTVGKHLFLSNFVTSSKGLGDIQPSHAVVAHFAMQSYIVSHSNNVQRRAHLACTLHREWENYASQLTTEYRRLTKESRNLTKKLLSLEEEQKQQVLLSTPQRHCVSGSQATDARVLSLTADVTSKQRDSRVKQVREMWKMLNKFVDSTGYQQEVVDSVVQERVNMYAIGASDIAFQIPEMVLQEYEALSREGTAANTYHAGKLNLLCLIEMWKCSLHIIKNQIQKDGFPAFEEELGRTNSALHTHRAHLAAATNLRASLQTLKASLEESIQQLESELQDHRSTPLSMYGGGDPAVPQLFVPEVTMPSLGLDLVPPSPVRSYAAKTPDWKAGRAPGLSLLTQEVSTPDAVREISQSIHQASHLRHKKLPQQASSRLPLSAKMKAVSRSQNGGNHSQRDVTSHEATASQLSHLSLPNGSFKSEGEFPSTLPISAGGLKSGNVWNDDTVTPVQTSNVRRITRDWKSQGREDVSIPKLNGSDVTPKLKGTGVNFAPHQESSSSVTPTPHQGGLNSVMSTPHREGHDSVTSTPHREGHSSVTSTPHQGSHSSVTSTPRQGGHSSVASTPHQGGHSSVTSTPHQGGHSSVTSTPHQGSHSSVTSTPRQGGHNSVTSTPHQGGHSSVTSSHSSVTSTPHRGSSSVSSTHSQRTHPHMVPSADMSTPQFKATTSRVNPPSQGATRTEDGSRPPLNGKSTGTPQLKYFPRAHEILADQIAAAVSSLDDSGDSPAGDVSSPDQLHSVVNTVAAMGRDAFHSCDLIPRTPLSKREPSAGRRGEEPCPGWRGEEPSPRKTSEEPSAEQRGEIQRLASEDTDKDVDFTLPAPEETFEQDENQTSQTHPDHCLQFKSTSTVKDSSTQPLQEHNHTPNSTLSINDHTLNSQGSDCDEDVSADDPEPLFTLATPKLAQSSSALRLTSRTSHTSGRVGLESVSSPSLPSSLYRTTLPSPLKGDKFSTPTTQAWSFLEDIQPPTPFQHAQFDLDTPEGEHFTGSHVQIGDSGSVVERKNDTDQGSILVKKDSRSGSSEIEESGDLLIDFSTPCEGLTSPLLASTAQPHPNHQQHHEAHDKVPSYLYPSAGDMDSRTTAYTKSSSIHNPWSTTLNIKSSDLDMFGDDGSPELVSLSGSEFSTSSSNINVSQDAECPT